MIIKYYGHACFGIYPKTDKIIIDPYDESIGLGKLDLEATKLLISHEHYDHNARENVTIVEKENSIENTIVREIKSYHDDKLGALRGENKIHVIECEEKTICHLGDLGHMLDEETIEKMGHVDILMIPVGSIYTIDYKVAKEIIQKIKPNVIIPMHYDLEDCNISLDKIELFLNATSNVYHIYDIKGYDLHVDKDLKDGIYVMM